MFSKKKGASWTYDTPSSYYIVIESSALTFWIIAINQVTISIQVSLLFSCLLQQSLLPTRKLGL